MLACIPDFSLAQDRKREWLSRVHIRYRRIIEEWKVIENDFYVNDSPNGGLESEFQKDSRSCSYKRTPRDSIFT